MFVNCRFCGEKIPVRMKITAAEEIQDERVMELENLESNSLSPKILDLKKEPVSDWKLRWLDKGTREYKYVPGRNPILDDAAGETSVASISNNVLMVKCNECGNRYANTDPNAFDVYHCDNELDNPSTAPTAYQNEIHPDFKNVKSTPDVNIDRVINKTKKLIFRRK